MSEGIFPSGRDSSLLCRRIEKGVPARTRSVFDTSSDTPESVGSDGFSIKFWKTERVDSLEDIAVLRDVVLKKELDVVRYMEAVSDSALLFLRSDYVPLI